MQFLWARYKVNHNQTRCFCFEISCKDIKKVYVARIPVKQSWHINVIKLWQFEKMVNRSIEIPVELFLAWVARGRALVNKKAI